MNFCLVLQNKRYFQTSCYLCASNPISGKALSRIHEILRSDDDANKDVNENTKRISKSAKLSFKNIPNTLKNVIDGPHLMKELCSRSNIPINFKVSNQKYSILGQFLTTANVKLDWSVYHYNQIPGEAERFSTESKLNEQEEDIAVVDGLEGIIRSEANEPTESIDLLDTAENVKNLEGMKKGHIKYLKNKERTILRNEMENSLPEIIFLGRCNSGKSSLINALLSKNREAMSAYARVKDTAGYTPCLNFYNVGGLFRLVDSPGYGEKGQNWQGELTFQYLANRRVLKNCYLILDSKIGLNQYDEMILTNLTQLGVQFDIIFNKIDKIEQNERLKTILKLADEPILKNLKIQPRYYCVSSVDGGNKKDLKSRTGIKELLYGILESCGFAIDNTLKAIKKRKTVNEGDSRRKYKNMQKSLKHLAKKKK